MSRRRGRDGFAAVTDRIDTWVAERDLSGTALVTRGGEVLYEHQCGYADRASGVPVTPATRFALASVTKMFTAVTIAALAESGGLRFSDPVVDLLPDTRRPSTLLPEVTLHHLLTHTSGIADYAEEDEESPLFVADYGSLWDSRPVQSMQRPRDFLPLFGHLPPYRPPGERHQYSNAGYIVLGLVVEEVTGQAFTAAVQEHVFDRAGMTSSGFFRSDEAVPDVAVGYLPRAGADVPWRTNVFRVPVIGGADGGAHSTARDLDRFLHLHSDGTLLGSTRDAVLARHVDAGEGYASGYGVLHYPDGRLGHGGGDPGVQVLVNRFPATDVHVIVLCNGEGLAGDVRDLLVDATRRMSA